jgi:hypothetical protein
VYVPISASVVARYLEPMALMVAFDAPDARQKAVLAYT